MGLYIEQVGLILVALICVGTFFLISELGRQFNRTFKFDSVLGGSEEGKLFAS